MRRVLVRFTWMGCLLLAPAAMYAQSARLNLDLPPAIAARATESVDVTLDSSMLRLAAKFLSDDDDDRAARDMIRKLEGIYVRSYEFEHEGDYDRASVDRLRSQLGPTWKRIVTVHSRSKENVEIYADTRGETIAGLFIISAEPRELTVVNIVGHIDLDKLASLEGQFGIPRITNSKERKSHE
jgi:hypothetical protein